MNLRNYGLGQIGEPSGKPIASPIPDPEMVCPNCGCEAVHEITQKMVWQNAEGIGTYAGCPACPWASRMAVLVTPNPEEV